MKQISEVRFRDIEIPAIIHDLGIDQQTPELLIYNSLLHPSGFFLQKPFRSKHFSIIVVRSGKLSVKVNLFEYQLNEKSVIIIPPSAIREMNWKPGEVDFISLLFTPKFLQQSGIMGKYFNLANFMKEGLTAYREMEERDHQIVIKLTEMIYALLNNKNHHPYDLEVISNLFKAIAVKVKQYYDSPEADKNLSGTVIYRFMNLLGEHYLTHREVSFYAEKLYLNDKYLSQLLKSQTGKTARQFITEMVVLEAKVLLDERSLSIKQIANRLNFENQFHFSRFFKQYAGRTPTEYRKRLHPEV